MGSMCLMAVVAGVMGANIPDDEAIRRQIEVEGLRWRAGATPFCTGERPLPQLSSNDPLADVASGYPAQTTPAPELQVYAETTDLHFSWHDVWGDDYMTPVRDQGECGACFVFSSLGAVEALFAIALGEPRYDPDLSEQHAISCLSFGSCTDGGTAQEVAALLQHDGVVDEVCRPYQDSDAPLCSEGLCADAAVRTTRVAGWSTSVLPWGEAQLKQHLLAGPLVVNMRIYNDFLAYSSGVYERTATATPVGWHAVVLVGWDDGEDSWIARNSWGTAWGEDGYFRISRASDCTTLLDGVCFASNAVAFTVDAAEAPALPCLEPWSLYASVDSTTPLATFDALVSNCGGHAPLAWSAVAPAGVQVLPGAGVLAPAQQQAIEIQVDVTSLATGANELGVDLVAAAGASRLRLNLDVTSRGAPLQADFDAMPLRGEAPLTVTFMNRTSGIAQDFSWTFGDGTQSQEPSPQHTYQRAGAYTVSLTATGDGQTSTQSYQDLITVSSPGDSIQASSGVCGCTGGAAASAWTVMVAALCALRRRRRHCGSKLQ